MNVRLGFTNYIEENIGENPHDVNFRGIFKDSKPLEKQAVKINNWNSIKLRSFATTKERRKDRRKEIEGKIRGRQEAIEGQRSRSFRYMGGIKEWYSGIHIQTTESTLKTGDSNNKQKHVPVNMAAEGGVREGVLGALMEGS